MKKSPGVGMSQSSQELGENRAQPTKRCPAPGDGGGLSHDPVHGEPWRTGNKGLVTEEDRSFLNRALFPNSNDAGVAKAGGGADFLFKPDPCPGIGRIWSMDNLDGDRLAAGTDGLPDAPHASTAKEGAQVKGAKRGKVHDGLV